MPLTLDPDDPIEDPGDGAGSRGSVKTLEVLEEWCGAEKCRSACIDIDDGYGATCWRVELRRGENTVHCSETNFVACKGIDPTWHEHEEGDLTCCVVNGDSMDDWPGLDRTILHAIECANRFWKSDAC